MSQKETDKIKNKSTSAEPDLDWSQVRETILMLNLATARIEFCMRDGDDSVETLTDSFTTIAGNVAKLRSAMESVLENYDVDEKMRDQITVTGQEISNKMQSIIVAFQFYDKLVQRLAHISKSMAALGDLVGDPSRLYSPYEWRGLQEKIRSTHSMSDEKKLLDALIGGATVEEVVRLLEEEQKAQGSEIEMF